MTRERRDKLLGVLAKRQPDLTVVLENVFDPHNISAVMRTCDAVGIQEIYILNTRQPRQAKWGFKSSSSASKWLSVHVHEDVESCFHELRKFYSRIITTHLGDDPVPLHDVDFTQSTAIIFGNEQTGVSQETRSLADGNFIIPQVGIISSLNISVACAVTVYEAYRQKNLAGHYQRADLYEGRKQELIEKWDVKDRDGINADQ